MRLGAESQSLDRNSNGPRAARGVMLGAGAALGGIGLVWAARRLSPRLYLAPGWPGVPARWSPSDKDGVGTAIGPEGQSQSLVWFTLGHGAINEVFYPRVDLPCTRDLALIVTDGRRFFSDERCDTLHQIESLGDGVPAYRITNTCRWGRYRIEKTVIAHPGRSAVVQHTRFVPLRGVTRAHRLFAVLDPRLGLRDGLGETGRVGHHKGRAVLTAERKECALALVCSREWSDASAGFAGTISDGRRDLARHGRLTRHYHCAPLGNVLLTGEIPLDADRNEFVLALGFGLDAGEAAHHALSAAHDDFGALLEEHVNGWRAWHDSLAPAPSRKGQPLKASSLGGGSRLSERLGAGESERVGAERDLERTSAMVLRVHEAKTVPGAIVASLSVPWGQAFGDRRQGPGQGGYHMVWPRDLSLIAGGLLAAGANAEAHRTIAFLRNTQEADGHWPQNMWACGVAFWSGNQLGETALPVLLADLIHREGSRANDRARDWPMVREAASYIVRNGPSTQEDRWENERGFNPYTIAVSIAALLVAAEMAEGQGEPREARYLRETADAWCSSIDYWTYVENTRLAQRVGVAGHYLRIAPPDHCGEPSKYAEHLRFWYQGRRARHGLPPSAIVGPDALAYVRFGLRAADDPRIVATLKVVDAVTKVETPYGPAWHRYNHDGYGEKLDGAPFDGKRGHGRAWPLLTAERAHFELAAGRPDEAERLARAVERFAGPAGMIPEQIWDTYDIPKHDLYFGRPSGSAMPLAWAHSEYLKLRRSLRDGRIFDLPPQTVQRYLIERVWSPRVSWRIDHRRGTVPAGKALRIELRSPAVVQWRAGARFENGVMPTRDSGLGVHYADLPTERLAPGDTVRFTIAWRGPSREPWRTAAQAVLPHVVRIEEAEGEHEHEHMDGGADQQKAGKGGRRSVPATAGANGAVIGR